MNGSPRDWMRRVVVSRLEKLAEGEITLVEEARERRFGSAGEEKLSATVRVHDPEFYLDVALGGTLGAGESYVDGRWSCDDLTVLFRILLRNQQAFGALDGGAVRLSQPARRLLHAVRRNTRHGSRRNIAAHYDLGNDFFALFLDRTMTYSAGIFERPDAPLEDASRAKYERICRKLRLGPEHHVLEIGGGWGGFAQYAARRSGCRVTTTTISARQHEYARERIARARLRDRVTVLREDYRDLRGRYDRLVSIEMIEAVGHAYYEDYFRVCAERLHEGGAMLLQAITVPDRRYERSRRSVDFIKKYIFPGGCLPSLKTITQVTARVGDLQVAHVEDISAHYALTLRHWWERTRAARDRILALGYSESFLRMWEFYLRSCEAAFRERYVGDLQILLAKPRCGLAPVLGALEETVPA